jgi:hypothetical protein
VGIAAAVIPAALDSADNGPAGTTLSGIGVQSAAYGSSSTSGSGDAAFFAASLNAANEVPVQGGPAVGDKEVSHSSS